LEELRGENAAVNEELKTAKEAADHLKEEALKTLEELRHENAAAKEELKRAKEAAAADHEVRRHLKYAVEKCQRQEQQLSILRERYHEEEQKRKDAWQQLYMQQHPRSSPVEEYWLQLPPHHPLAVITKSNSRAQKDQAWTKGTPVFDETEENKKTLIQLRSLFGTAAERRQNSAKLSNLSSHQITLAHRFFLAIHPLNGDLVAMSEKHLKMGLIAFHPDKGRGNEAFEYMRARMSSYVTPVTGGVDSPFSATNQLAQELSAALTHLEEEFIPEKEWLEKRDVYVEIKMASNELPSIDVVDLCDVDNESEDDDMDFIPESDDESI
jgi:hypothetical protein